MNEKPTSVTIIASLLIVTAGISLITSLFNLDNPVAREIMSRSPIPIYIQYIMLYAGLVVTMVSGIGMLRGYNWARYLYVIWSVIGFGIGFATAPIKTAMIPGLVLFIVFAFFLFRPKANAYFTGGDMEPEGENH